MSEIAPGTMVQMRVLRRWSHYNVGDMIAVTIDVGKDLEAKRLAQPMLILVPTAAGATVETPRAGLVKK